MSKPPADPRQQRLADALRANLARRKARERAERASDTPDGPDDALPPPTDCAD